MYVLADGGGGGQLSVYDQYTLSCKLVTLCCDSTAVFKTVFPDSNYQVLKILYELPLHFPSRYVFKIVIIQVPSSGQRNYN